jgi:Flp pilus assembly protein TadG
MISRLFKRVLAGTRGSSLVEFGLVSVLLVLVILGVVEMSRMVLVYTTIANAARAGARYAIVHGSDRPTGLGVDGPSGPGAYSQICTVVKNFASVGLLDTSKLTCTNRITVTYTPSNNKVGSNVQVYVTYPYDPWITYFAPLGSVTLRSISQGVITF